MHAGLLYMLHNAANKYGVTIADRIDIHLDRLLEESVQQNRAVIGDLDSLFHIDAQVVFIVNDFHRPPAENIGRPHDQWETNFRTHGHGFIFRPRNTIRRLLQFQPLQ